MVSFGYTAAALVCAVLVSLMVSSVQGQVCPEMCDCRPADGGTIVHCKYQRKIGFPATDQFPVDTIELDYEYNNISVLSSLPALGNLEKLILDNCEIQTIRANAFANAPALKNITLKSNMITTIEEEAFAGLPNLVGLYLEDNKFNVLPDRVFDSLNLVDLYLDGSSIHALSDNTFSGSTVQHLFMKRNNISRLTAGHIRPLKDSLVSFHLDNNGQNLVIDANTFDGFNSLEALSLRSSRMKDMAFLQFVNVKTLYLSGNMFPDLDLGPYPNLVSVETLELSNMGLATFHADKTLQHLSSLRKLDLSSNDMTRLDSYWFEKTPILSELNLRRNKLTELPSDLSANLKQLTSLDLSMNNLMFLSNESFAEMTKLSKLDFTMNKLQVFPESLKTLFSKVTSLSLRDNPLHCNCEMRWYREWLTTVPNANLAVMCKSPVQTYIYNLLPNQFKCVAPTFVSPNEPVYVAPGEDLLLICTAKGDPAPVVKWVDRYNESVTVTPSDDRSVGTNSNPWQLNSVTVEYSGIYTCTASNVAGTVSAQTEVFVTDNIPSTSTPTPTTRATTTAPTTAEPEKLTTANIQTNTSTSTSETIPSKKPNTSNKGSTTMKSEEMGNKNAMFDQKTLAIIIGSVGGFLILCVVLFLIIHITRHTRHKRRYEVNDKAIIYHHDTNELDISKDSKQMDV